MLFVDVENARPWYHLSPHYPPQTHLRKLTRFVVVVVVSFVKEHKKGVYIIEVIKFEVIYFLSFELINFVNFFKLFKYC